MSLTLYDNDFSTCAQKVRFLLHEQGAEWDTQWLDLRRGDQHRPDYLALNPSGVVPTLVHDGRVITESTLILAYLLDIDPDHRFAPSDAFDRHRARHWQLQLDTLLHGAIGALSIGISFRHDYLEKGEDALQAHLANIPDPIRRARWLEAVRLGTNNPGFRISLAAWRSALTALDRQLADTHWSAGDQFSIADIALAPYLTRLDHLGLLEALSRSAPRAGQMLDRLRERPAYTRSFDQTISAAKIARVRRHAEAEAPAIAALLAA